MASVLPLSDPRCHATSVYLTHPLISRFPSLRTHFITHRQCPRMSCVLVLSPWRATTASSVCDLVRVQLQKDEAHAHRFRWVVNRVVHSFINLPLTTSKSKANLWAVPPYYGGRCLYDHGGKGSENVTPVSIPASTHLPSVAADKDKVFASKVHLSLLRTYSTVL